MPIKFAPPPFGSSAAPPPPATIFVSLFDSSPAGQYSNAVVDGWTVQSNSVTVISDATLAAQGSGLLALANGSITRVLPTTVGRSYTLTYAYRGPGVAGWWRGENNGFDSIYGIGPASQSNSYVSGVVGQAFLFDPTPPAVPRLFVPDQQQYILTNSLSIEGWIRPHGATFDVFMRGDDRPGLDPYVLSYDGTTNMNLSFTIEDNLGNFSRIQTPTTSNQWLHVAGTMDGTTGLMSL
jgi:hypothetical protein